MSGFEAIRAVLGAADGLPPPELLDDFDGDLTLDWCAASSCVLTVTVSPSGRIGWSGLVDEWSGHGDCQDAPDEALRDAMYLWSRSSVNRKKKP